MFLFGLLYVFCTGERSKNLVYCALFALVVAQFFPPMAVALQRHYPVFLQPKTDVLELNLLAQYLRTFVALLLRAPYSFASKNIVFKSVILSAISYLLLSRLIILATAVSFCYQFCNLFCEKTSKWVVSVAQLVSIE